MNSKLFSIGQKFFLFFFSLPLLLPISSTDASDSTQNFKDYGKILSHTLNKNLKLNSQEQLAFQEGIKDGFHESISLDSLTALQDKTVLFLSQRNSKIMNEKETLFFTQLDKNPLTQKTPSGLYYEIIKPGNQSIPKSTDSVKVHYRGTLLDGTEFDSSYSRNQPSTFPVNGVIPGFAEGLQLIQKGGKIKLYIPAKLAYGDQSPSLTIPPNSPLIFEVELIDINP